MRNSASRYNIYSLVHKGLRACMSHTLLDVGRSDWQDDEDTRRVLGDVRQLLELCKGHLEHENRFIHSAMEARRPGSSALTAADHGDHEQAIRALQATALLIETASAGEPRETAAKALYHDLATFVAENFEHMAVEETRNNAVLWAAYTDAEIRDIEQALVASIPPEKNLAMLRWMVPYLSPSERAQLLGGIRRQAPSEVFDAMLAALQPVLTTKERLSLSHALGLCA